MAENIRKGSKFWENSMIGNFREKMKKKEEENKIALELENKIISDVTIPQPTKAEINKNARIYYAIVKHANINFKTYTDSFIKNISEIIKGIKAIYKLNGVGWLDNAEFIPVDFPFLKQIEKEQSRITLTFEEVKAYQEKVGLRKQDAIIIFDPFYDSSNYLGLTKFIQLSFISYRQHTDNSYSRKSNFTNEIISLRAAHELLHQYTLRLGYTLYGDKYFFAYHKNGHFEGDNFNELNLLMSGIRMQELKAVTDDKILNKQIKILNPVHNFFMQNYNSFMNMYEIEKDKKELCKKSLAWYDNSVVKTNNRLKNGKSNYINIVEQYIIRSRDLESNTFFVLSQDINIDDNPVYAIIKYGTKYSMFYPEKKYQFDSKQNEQIPPNIASYEK